MANTDHRLARWERKLATLTPGSSEYKKHMRARPKPPAAAGKRAAGKARSRPGVDWSGFKLRLRH